MTVDTRQPAVLPKTSNDSSTTSQCRLDPQRQLSFTEIRTAQSSTGIRGIDRSVYVARRSRWNDFGLARSATTKSKAILEAEKQLQARKKTREVLDTLTSDALSDWFTRDQELTQVQTEVLQRLLSHYAEFATEGGDSIEEKIGQIRALVRVGRIQRTLGNFAEAISVLGQAVANAGSAESPLTDDYQSLELVCTTNIELGIVHKFQRDYEDAANLFRIA